MKQLERKAADYFGDMVKKVQLARRIVITILSVLLMGFATALFSLSGFGVDPFTSMNKNIADTVGISFGTFQLIINFVILLLIVIFAHRGLVGIGTVINMVFVGYSCDLFENLLSPYANGAGIAARIVMLFVAIPLLCFATSLFFTADLGYGPYDTLGYVIARHGVKFKVGRVITDVSAVVIGLLVSGGAAGIVHGDFSHIKYVGIGTVITAFFMGPLISFFNKYVSGRIVNMNYEKGLKKFVAFMVKGAMVRNSMVSSDTVKPIYGAHASSENYGWYMPSVYIKSK